MRQFIKKYNTMTIQEIQKRKGDLFWVLASCLVWFAVFGFLASYQNNQQYWFFSIMMLCLVIILFNVMMHLNLLIYAKRNEQMRETLYLKNNLEVNKDATC